MSVGYVRVSSVEQNEERRIVELKQKAGGEKFFVDKVSSKSATRHKFDEMMNFLREGDELILCPPVHSYRNCQPLQSFSPHRL